MSHSNHHLTSYSDVCSYYKYRYILLYRYRYILLYRYTNTGTGTSYCTGTVQVQVHPIVQVHKYRYRYILLYRYTNTGTGAKLIQADPQNCCLICSQSGPPFHKDSD